MRTPGPVLAVVGPTTASKSALALALAGELGGQIVNADSMQLYRGMDIGTAKLPPAERAGIAHHLLDVWDVTAAANVAAYQLAAREVVDGLLARGVVPVLVGGSGLYVRAVLDDLRFPGTDAAVRSELEAELAADGPGPLHARLACVDPAAAAAILPTNGRRIVRALEVVTITGQPFPMSMSAYGGSTASRYDAVQVGLDPGVPELDARIEARVEGMWRAGLVEEVCRLVEVGLRRGVTARRALGYAQVLRLLSGEMDDETARSDTTRATRAFARRQRSWFRRDPRISWHPGAQEALAVVRRELVARSG
ncbi:MAG: tRNA (adenosine(37)-N6)-dimethylallyltransferase MiaA [Mycobacteriales bacterium]